MPFSSNSTLITAAYTVDLLANGSADLIAGHDGESDVFVVADGLVGDDTIDNFERIDSLVTHKKIFDGNNDGYIVFGANGVLDVDRYGSGNSKAGADQLTLTGSTAVLRYLGTKDGSDFVYADAAVRLDLLAAHSNTIEGTVGNDSFDASQARNIYLYDTALGINLGGDTITGFGCGDYIVTTHQIYDGNGDGVINWGYNDVLDLAAGEGAPSVTGPDTNPGGQIDFAGEVSSLTLDHTEVSGTSTYYFYTVA